MDSQTMMTPKDETDLLMKEYGFIKSEIQTYIGSFHRYSNMLPVILSAVIAVILSLLSAASKTGTGQTQLISTLQIKIVGGEYLNAFQFLIFVIFILLVTSSFFTIAASISYIHVLEVLCVRAKQIEEEINRLCGRKLMNWEIDLSPNLIRNTGAKGLWVMPSTLRLFWNYLGIIIFIGFIFIVSTSILGQLMGSVVRAYAGVGLVFQGSQYLLYRKQLTSLRGIAETMRITKRITNA